MSSEELCVGAVRFAWLRWWEVSFHDHLLVFYGNAVTEGIATVDPLL